MAKDKKCLAYMLIVVFSPCELKQKPSKKSTIFVSMSIHGWQVAAQAWFDIIFTNHWLSTKRVDQI